MADLNRRDAIRLALGMGDRIAMEREQQSAIDIVRGGSAQAPETASDVAPGTAPVTAPGAAPAPEVPRSFFARLAARLPFGRGDSGRGS